MVLTRRRTDLGVFWVFEQPPETK